MEGNAEVMVKAKSSRRTNLFAPPLCYLFILGALLFGLTERLPAQPSPANRIYKSNLADEDWSFLKDRSLRNDFWDSLKYIPLGKDGRYLTLSGEIRFRPEGFRIRGRGDQPSTIDNYFLQRYLFGADLHFSERFRLFAEIQSGLINGKLRSPRPTDKDTLDIHQGFFEWKQPLKGNRILGLKAGRQELNIGSSRLISASPGLNVKRSFDGAVLYYRDSAWRLNAAFAKLVSIKQGEFDNPPAHEQTFWGISASRKSPRFEHGELAFYYLNFDRLGAQYNQGAGRDQRNTLGVKWSGAGARADLNYDAVLQWGSFQGAAVRAWAFSTESGYRFISVPWKPRLSVRADIASGDEDPQDPRLQSFNPLFPGNSYSGAIGLLGPTNLTDLTPAVTFIVNKSLVLGVEAPSYWRTSTGDGVYGIDQSVLLKASVGQGKYVGTNPGFLVVWQATRHLMFQGVITRFLSGKFLDQTPFAPGIGFYSASAQYRF